MFKTRIGNGLLRKQLAKSRLNRERANLSFFFVIMFFAVFGIIVLTEVLLIDDKGRGQGVRVRKGYGNGMRYGDRSEYEDQGEEYFMYHDKIFDANLAAFLKGEKSKISGLGKSSNSQFDANLLSLSESKLPGLAVNQTAKDGEWQTVFGTRHKFFVYSAYYDKRKGRSVRVIAATKTRGADRVWCRFWYPYNTGNRTVLVSFSVPAQYKVCVSLAKEGYVLKCKEFLINTDLLNSPLIDVIKGAPVVTELLRGKDHMIRENWNLRYSACFLICPLKHNLTVPASVSIVPRLRLPPSNLLAVQNPDKDPAIINRTIPSEALAVCVKPLHYHYNKALHMLEFLEMYRILGVEHITMYNHTIGPAVDCILENYKSKGIVTILPWQLDMKSQKEIRTEGLFAALNDCLYRDMYKYSYVAMIDLDEFIIPRHNDTLMDLIRWIAVKVRTTSTGSFSFQNAFFYLQWEDDPLIASSKDLSSKLITLKKTKRKTKLHPHKQRSKYICRPEFVVEAGNHFIWEFLPGHGTVNVPADAAILHHYRVCEFGGNDCIKTSNIRDRTVFRYRDRLVNNVKAKWDELKSSCKLFEDMD